MYYLMHKYSISCRYRQEIVHIPMTIVVDAIVSLGKFPSFALQRCIDHLIGFLPISEQSIKYFCITPGCFIGRSKDSELQK